MQLNRFIDKLGRKANAAVANADFSIYCLCLWVDVCQNPGSLVK